MRATRLLTRGQRGSAPLESVFAIILLLFFVLSVVQVAFLLYARNTLAAAAHEGARAVVELGSDPSDAVAVATSVVQSSAGGLVGNLRVQVHSVPGGERGVVRVRVDGAVRPFGPIPFGGHLTAYATTVRPEAAR